ncbi:hypothetical protein AB0I60_01525 [Actinosynnema sp. NPDC050436]|uniref:hypothetical protein n=1 Tax=Actinosynnema sp. NPDC050436 TaxID=3155659 RepID=UPI0033D45A7E
MRNPTLLGRRDLVDVVRPVHPVASVHLGPPSDVPWPDRLDAVVGELRRDGADEATVRDLHTAVPTDPGTPVVVFADGGHVPAVYATPGRTGPDTARFTAPAHVLPLMAWSQERPPCVVVVAGRDHVKVSTAGDGVEPGPVRCAPADVPEVSRAALDRIGARLVVVCGDDLLVGVLRAALAPDATVRRTARPWGERLADVARSTSRLWTAQSLADLAGQSPERAVRGVEATLDALARSRVRELLVVSPPPPGGTAWFGSRAAQVARRTATPGTGAVVDVAPPWSRGEGTAVDVAVRSALVGGASVRVLRPGTPGTPVGGIGALCRFPLTVVRP